MGQLRVVLSPLVLQLVADALLQLDLCARAPAAKPTAVPSAQVQDGSADQRVLIRVKSECLYLIVFF